MCKVLLDSIEKVRKFVSITSRFDTEVSLKAGRYIVDAKSIMGIFSVDLTKPMELQFETNGKADSACIAKYIEQVDEFVVA
ncbi:MAG: HPr family phosphocarrier protein [Lachnospiraceae bacterium]|jgi:phosphotransferase system HPr-like phosphotransfer protein|nr:HPr family phosphocarrier protein [Lachnospiraceae bacterium]MCI9662154.1 HPr family phosphocarrier protein [Lachnospiraceae bacterium]